MFPKKSPWHDRNPCVSVAGHFRSSFPFFPQIIFYARSSVLLFFEYRSTKLGVRNDPGTAMRAKPVSLSYNRRTRSMRSFLKIFTPTRAPILVSCIMPAKAASRLFQPRSDSRHIASPFECLTIENRLLGRIWREHLYVNRRLWGWGGQVAFHRNPYFFQVKPITVFCTTYRICPIFAPSKIIKELPCRRRSLHVGSLNVTLEFPFLFFFLNAAENVSAENSLRILRKKWLDCE